MSGYLTDITEERLHYQVGQRADLGDADFGDAGAGGGSAETRSRQESKPLSTPCVRPPTPPTSPSVMPAASASLSVNPDEIGKSMEGGDSDEALINAKSYVCQCAKAPLGSSLRGKIADSGRNRQG